MKQPVTSTRYDELFSWVCVLRLKPVTNWQPRGMISMRSAGDQAALRRSGTCLVRPPPASPSGGAAAMINPTRYGREKKEPHGCPVCKVDPPGAPRAVSKWAVDRIFAARDARDQWAGGIAAPPRANATCGRCAGAVFSVDRPGDRVTDLRSQARRGRRRRTQGWRAPE